MDGWTFSCELTLNLHITSSSRVFDTKRKPMDEEKDINFLCDAVVWTACFMKREGARQ